MELGSRKYWIAAGIGYVALVGVLVGGMFALQQSVMTQYSTPESIADWQTWRADVEQQGGSGSVQRRTPKSTEPPALVLMRDYFGVSLAGAVFFPSILYWVVAWFVAGAMSSNQQKLGGFA
jgi:hypothetical protein